MASSIMQDFFNPLPDSILGMIINSLIGLIIFISLEIVVSSEIIRYFIALFTALSCALIAQFGKTYIYPKIEKYTNSKLKLKKNVKKN